MNKFLRDANSYFFKKKAVPKNTDETSSGLEVGGSNSALEIIFDVTTKIEITATKALTVKVEHSDDNDTYTELATVYTATSPSDIDVCEGWLRYTLPVNVKKYARVKVTTNDGSAVGAVSAYLHLV